MPNNGFGGGREVPRADKWVRGGLLLPGLPGSFYLANFETRLSQLGDLARNRNNGGAEANWRNRPGCGRPEAPPRRPAPPADFIRNRDPAMAHRGMNVPV